MAFGHGIAATLSVGGTALEGYLENASMDLARELAEIKVFDSDSVARVAGLRNCTFTAGGPYDPTCDAALFAAWDGAAAVAVIFKPQSTVTYTVDCFVASYNVAAGSGDKVTWTVNLSSDGDVARA